MSLTTPQSAERWDGALVSDPRGCPPRALALVLPVCQITPPVPWRPGEAGSLSSGVGVPPLCAPVLPWEFPVLGGPPFDSSHVWTAISRPPRPSCSSGHPDGAGRGTRQPDATTAVMSGTARAGVTSHQGTERSAFLRGVCPAHRAPEAHDAWSRASWTGRWDGAVADTVRSVATYRLGVSCEPSPQIDAPALVRTHQGQLTGTSKIFGMPRNRNTATSRLVVTT